MKCIYTYTDCYIDFDGNARPCCNGNTNYGNLHNDSLSIAFSSDKANDLRIKLAENDPLKIPTGCNNCSLLARLPTEYSFVDMYKKPDTDDSVILQNYLNIQEAFFNDTILPPGTKPLKS
jgi:hypothetical protein